MPYQRRYTRIRIQNAEDIGHLYSLLIEYIKQPALANSVKEFVYKLLDEGHRFGCYLGEEESPDEAQGVDDNLVKQAIDEDQEDVVLLSQALDALDLGEKKQEWLRQLVWMNPKFGGRQRDLTTHVENFKRVLSYRTRAISFAQHASALLLTLCPNVEKLTFEESRCPAQDVLVRNNYGLLPGMHLQNLQHVTLLPSSDIWISDPRFYSHIDVLQLLRMFHRLPSIQSVSVDLSYTNGDADHRVKFPPATSSITKLDIEHTTLGTDVLAPLIRIPRDLEELTIKTGGRAHADGGGPWVMANALGKALLCQKHSLRKLDLDMDEHFHDHMGGRWDEEDDDLGDFEDWELDEFWRSDEEISPGPLSIWDLSDTREYAGTIGSLHDFDKLTNLSIGLFALLGPWSSQKQDFVNAPHRLVDAFPKNLEYLLIRGYERGKVHKHDVQIEEFLAERADRFPRLKEIHGIHELLPSATSVHEPDGNQHMLYEPEPVSDDWMLAQDDVGESLL